MNNFEKKHPELWKFVKFNITVIVTSALDLAIYTFLLYCVFYRLSQTPVGDNAFIAFLGIRYKGYLYSYAISTTLGYVASYLMNRHMTFYSDVNPVKSSVQYALMAFVTIIFSTWLGGVVGTFMQEHNLSNPFTELVAKFIVINIPTIWTYPLERFVIQKKKNKVALIAADLDGTLLNDDSEISAENLDAIERLAEKGVKVVISTGRTIAEIPSPLLECDGIAGIIYSNGAGITDKNGSDIYSNFISAEIALEVYKILNEYDTLIELYADKTPIDNAEMLQMKTLEYFDVAPSYREVILKTRCGCEDIAAQIKAARQIEMFNVYFATADERALTMQKLKNFDGIEFTTSSENNLEILADGTGKGAALEYFCCINGIERSRRIAVGDSKNDLSMFEAVENGYAVANACDALKARAKKVICSNNENAAQYLLRTTVQ